MLNNQKRLSNPINLIEQIILSLNVYTGSKWDHFLIQSASFNLTLGFISPLMLIANGLSMNRVNSNLVGNKTVNGAELTQMEENRTMQNVCACASHVPSLVSAHALPRYPLPNKVTLNKMLQQ